MQVAPRPDGEVVKILKMNVRFLRYDLTIELARTMERTMPAKPCRCSFQSPPDKAFLRFKRKNRSTRLASEKEREMATRGISSGWNGEELEPGAKMVCNGMVDILTRQSLDTAAQVVQSELSAHGLWGRVRRAEIYWCALPQWPFDALGFFVHAAHPLARFFGYAPGYIYIPSFSFWNRSIRDVLRHEYAHAIAHYYPAAVQRSAAFRGAFGGDYWSEAPRPHVRRMDCVSRYAMSCPMEDFAETLMLFLRRKGRPLKRMSLALRRKWAFVRKLGGVTDRREQCGPS